MTCVVALEQDNKVYMGADSYAGNNMDYLLTKEKKVFKVRISEDDEMLFGIAGTLRGMQLMKYHPWIPEYREKIYSSPLEYLCTDFMESLRSLFKNNGYGYVDDAQDQQGDQILLGWKGSIYLIEGNYQVVTSQDSFNAIGCGTPYAMAVINTMLRSNVMCINEEEKCSPEFIIQEALDITSSFCTGCKRPFVIDCV